MIIIYDCCQRLSFFIVYSYINYHWKRRNYNGFLKRFCNLSSLDSQTKYPLFIEEYAQSAQSLDSYGVQLGKVAVILAR